MSHVFIYIYGQPSTGKSDLVKSAKAAFEKENILSGYNIDPKDDDGLHVHFRTVAAPVFKYEVVHVNSPELNEILVKVKTIFGALWDEYLPIIKANWVARVASGVPDPVALGLRSSGE